MAKIYNLSPSKHEKIVTFIFSYYYKIKRASFDALTCNRVLNYWLNREYSLWMYHTNALNESVHLSEHPVHLAHSDYIVVVSCKDNQQSAVEINLYLHANRVILDNNYPHHPPP